MSTSELFLCKKYSLYVTQSEIALKRALGSLCEYDKSVCYCNIATAEYGEMKYSRLLMYYISVTCTYRYPLSKHYTLHRAGSCS